MYGNNIGVEGAKRLAEALEKNTTLNVLDLYDNNIGDKGATRIAEALEKNTSLKELYLGFNNIGDEGAKRLAEALEKNTSLNVLGLRFNNIGYELERTIIELIWRNQAIQNDRPRRDAMRLLLAETARAALPEAAPLLTSFDALADDVCACLLGVAPYRDAAPLRSVAALLAVADDCGGEGSTQTEAAGAPVSPSSSLSSSSSSSVSSVLVKAAHAPSPPAAATAASPLSVPPARGAAPACTTATARDEQCGRTVATRLSGSKRKASVCKSSYAPRELKKQKPEQ